MTRARRERPVRVVGHLEGKQLCPREPDLPGKRRCPACAGTQPRLAAGSPREPAAEVAHELQARPRMGAGPHRPQGPPGS